MVFTFEHVALDQEPDRGKWALADLPLPVLKDNLDSWQRGLAEAGWNSLYWDNHDQPRAVSRFGDDSPEHRVASAKTLGTVLHLHKGTPYVYQGEELGMTNADFDPHRAVPRHRVAQLPRRRAHPGDGRAGDPATSLSVKSRDNARTPMQWDDSEHAGFTDGRARGCRSTRTRTSINAAAAEADPDSVFHHYRRLIELRHEHPVVVDGRFDLLLPDARAALGVHPDARRRPGCWCSPTAPPQPATAPAGDLPDIAGRRPAAGHAPRPGRARPRAVGVPGLPARLRSATLVARASTCTTLSPSVTPFSPHDMSLTTHSAA